MNSQSIKIGVFSIAGFIAGAIMMYFIAYQNNLEINELRYLDRAIDLKWNIIMLSNLKESKIDNAIKYQEELIDSALIELSNYGNDSIGVHHREIKEIIDSAISYKEKNERVEQ